MVLDLLIFFAFFHCGFFVLPDNVDLGTACGKYFRVSCLSILDPGNHKFIFSLYDCIINVTDLVYPVSLLLRSSGDSDIIKSLPGDQ
jgi:hypothetical protein